MGSVSSVNETTDVRTDRDPLAKRFPRLGAFTGVHWLGGTLGDDRAPGPSTYFIEAVVALPPGVGARLQSTYGLVPAADGPRPPPALVPFMPDGASWSRSAALESGFGPPDWGAQVWVDTGRGLAYVSSKGR